MTCYPYNANTGVDKGTSVPKHGLNAYAGLHAWLPALAPDYIDNYKET